jgi:hypothetical protein
MDPKFPVWMTIALTLQILIALAFSAYLLILGSGYNGESSLDLASLAGLMILLLPPMLCSWLAHRQWLAGRFTAAKVLALAPVLLVGFIGVGAEFVMA